MRIVNMVTAVPDSCKPLCNSFVKEVSVVVDDAENGFACFVYIPTISSYLSKLKHLVWYSQCYY